MGISQYLQEKGWKRKVNEINGIAYYEKENNPIKGLLTNKELFRDLGKRKFTKLETLLADVRNFFDGRGYDLLQNANVINRQKDTLFIGSGLQTIYNMLVKERVSKNVPYFIAQPSIRINALKKVALGEGYSTSFVNICTEKIGASVADHMDNLENWFDFLSRSGLYIGHMKLVENPNWRGGDFLDGESLLIYYGDLQIGDAVFVHGINKRNKERFTLSDIGFGLERLSWALNKSPSYYDVIGPFFEVKNRGKISLDVLRTLTLMAMNGITPSNKGVGYRFRQFTKKYLENGRHINPLFEIRYYFNFWKKLTNNYRPLEQVEVIVNSEIHKQLILDIANKAGVNLKNFKFSSFEEFINECFIRCPQKISDIEKFIGRH